MDDEKETAPSLSRRAVLAGLAALPAASATLGPAAAQAGPLPSWNDGPAKQAIFDFVRATIDRTSPSYVPPEDRIAVFDQDGTLWVEHPLYTQFVFCLDRVPAVVAQKPALKNTEPFKTVLSGNREAIARLSAQDFEKIAVATLTGMSVEQFGAEVRTWLERARHPRWNRPYTELVYQPMLEVLPYLRNNAYRTYIVTGGGQDFVRVYAEKVYGVPPEQVVGTALASKFGHGKDGKPELTKEPKLLFVDDHRRQARRHKPHDRPAAVRGVRQFDRRSRHAGVDRGRQRRPAEDAGAARRCRARIRLRARGGPARLQGRHLHAGALRPGQEERLDRDQHEERLEADLRIRSENPRAVT